MLFMLCHISELKAAWPLHQQVIIIFAVRHHHGLSFVPKEEDLLIVNCQNNIVLRYSTSLGLPFMNFAVSLEKHIMGQDIQMKL